MKFDIYYNQGLCDASKKISEDRSRIHTYISRANLQQYAGKTYDTTIDEETDFTIGSIEEAKENKDIKTTQKTIKFFGLGFTDSEYQWLQNQYDDWITRHECKTKAQEVLFKNICIAELQIQKAAQTNGKVDSYMKSLQDLLGSANLKPTQNNDNALADQNTFGTLINKWENEKPIPEPDPEWKDVDGIARYVTVFFLGHLCKMMGIKNSYSKEYEKEMEKYRVEKPEYFEDEEVDFDKIFGGDTDG